MGDGRALRGEKQRLMPAMRRALHPFWFHPLLFAVFPAVVAAGCEQQPGQVDPGAPFHRRFASLGHPDLPWCLPHPSPLGHGRSRHQRGRDGCALVWSCVRRLEGAWPFRGDTGPSPLLAPGVRGRRRGGHSLVCPAARGGDLESGAERGLRRRRRISPGGAGIRRRSRSRPAGLLRRSAACNRRLASLSPTST